MFGNGSPEPSLFKPARGSHSTGRTRSQVCLVDIALARPPRMFVLASRLLIVNVVQRAVLPEGAVVKPIVPHPTIDHGRKGHRNFQGGMRMHCRHYGGKPLVRAADGANPSVGFG